MEYGLKEAVIDLDAIRAGTASFEAQARVEHLFLQTMNSGGLSGLARLLHAIPKYNFRQLEHGGSAEEVRYSSTRGEGAELVIDASVLPGVAFIDVKVLDESPPPAAPAPDPRHEVFYGIWESMLGLEDSAVEALEPPQRAVYLIGLLEAEIMNGGLGQYLTNTEGAHLEPTLRLLEEIGATGTHRLLLEAVRLSSDAESFVAAWENKAEDFSALDDTFLAIAEDLAGLTADAFLDTS